MGATTTKLMTITTTTEGEAATLVRLMTWLSPSFPVGAFGYSHGLEQAAASGLVWDGESLFQWLAALIRHGGPWTDAVLLKAAYEAPNAEALAEVCDLAFALCPCAERLKETLDQGAAFAAAAGVWSGAAGVELGPEAAPYPVAVAVQAARASVPVAQVIAAYLQAFAANLVSAALRLAPIGQRDGVAVLARLEPIILQTAARAAASTLDDLGGAAMMSDIMAMRHETLEPRIFIT
jgi:urease accessory protein